MCGNCAYIGNDGKPHSIDCNCMREGNHDNCGCFASPPHNCAACNHVVMYAGAEAK